MKKFLVLFTLATYLILGTSFKSYAQMQIAGFNSDVSKVGTTAAAFLSIGVGARANAMGGAYTSIADDVTALFWNPAGIATMRQSQVALIHSDWIADLSHDFIGIAIPLGNLGTVGFSLNALTMDDIEVTTPDYPEGYGEWASSNDMAIGATYARTLNDRLSIGGTVKYIRSQLWHMTASTMAVDLGITFTDLFDFFKIGAAISNMGGKMRYFGRDTFVYHDIVENEAGNNEKIDADLQTGSYNIPITFRAGISAVVNRDSQMPLLFAVEFFEPSDNVRSLNVGCEWAYFDKIFLRGGYSSLFEDDTEKGLTLGGGLKLRVPRSLINIYLDYSYEDFGLFDNTQKFSLCVGF